MPNKSRTPEEQKRITVKGLETRRKSRLAQDAGRNVMNLIFESEKEHGSEEFQSFAYNIFLEVKDHLIRHGHRPEDLQREIAGLDDVPTYSAVILQMIKDQTKQLDDIQRRFIVMERRDYPLRRPHIISRKVRSGPLR